MFAIDKDAIQYIESKSGAVVINLELEPAAGG
ncbi:hypothetical protein DESME_04425 [Desulfitobacterium metallireducens DSM 15288]|uniref:Uncharacterized protein n=2 Tax=Desulfitobacterium TaxID=36853 RepID=W0ECH8_9FIRM|nr:hypothetical protein DESME_04425 [Desulfitobacterium metallireducens DSM 15288]